MLRLLLLAFFTIAFALCLPTPLSDNVIFEKCRPKFPFNVLIIRPREEIDKYDVQLKDYYDCMEGLQANKNRLTLSFVKTNIYLKRQMSEVFECSGGDPYYEAFDLCDTPTIRQDSCEFSPFIECFTKQLTAKNPACTDGHLKEIHEMEPIFYDWCDIKRRISKEFYAATKKPITDN